MATKSAFKQENEVNDEIDYSLNDVALRGWVTTIATERELPSGVS